MLIGVGVSGSIISYFYVSCSGSIISVGEERADFSANHLLVSMWGFLFLLVLGIGCVILL